jgi:hypothetical protein
MAMPTINNYNDLLTINLANKEVAEKLAGKTIKFSSLKIDNFDSYKENDVISRQWDQVLIAVEEKDGNFIFHKWILHIDTFSQEPPTLSKVPYYGYYQRETINDFILQFNIDKDYHYPFYMDVLLNSTCKKLVEILMNNCYS